MLAVVQYMLVIELLSGCGSDFCPSSPMTGGTKSFTHPCFRSEKDMNASSHRSIHKN